MVSKKNEKLYSEEISLLTTEELEDYVRLNLRKVSSYRRKFNIPVIGIAGSEGKTTTKRMLSAILSSDYNVLQTLPNCSTTSGVTSTLLKLKDSHDFAILELGIVIPKQFELAVQIAEPNIAVVTNIGEAHLATLGDKYLIADAKTALVRNLPKDGIAILNIDDDLVSDLANFSPSPRIIKFGLNKNAHFFANKIEYLGPDGIRFCVNDFYEFHMPIYSSTSIYNALSAISIARVLEIEFEDIKRGLENRFALLKRSGNLIKHNSLYILDYTYDATVNSVNKACESLVQFKPFSQKLILVLGDIRNPGPNPKEAHLKLGFYIAALPIDSVLTIGNQALYVAEGIKRMNHSNKAVEICKDNHELLKKISNNIVPNSTLLFIGSKDIKLFEPLQEFLNT